MDYLVEVIITIPDDAPQPEIEQRLAGETTRVAELAAQGHVLRVWKPLPEDGSQRALGLYRAATNEELEAILDSLPLRPWMEISVTALAEHPNDPAVGRMSAANRPTTGGRKTAMDDTRDRQGAQQREAIPEVIWDLVDRIAITDEAAALRRLDDFRGLADMARRAAQRDLALARLELALHSRR